jgi:hypothetical protein
MGGTGLKEKVTKSFPNAFGTPQIQPKANAQQPFLTGFNLFLHFQSFSFIYSSLQVSGFIIV